MPATSHSTASITVPPPAGLIPSGWVAAGTALITLIHAEVSNLSTSRKFCILKTKLLILSEYVIRGLLESFLV